jgi:multiple sugar transport system substrate-binding protein
LLADPTYSTITHMSSWLESLKGPNVKTLASTPYSSQSSTDLASAFDSTVRGNDTPQQAMQKVAGQAKPRSTCAVGTPAVLV